jgi:UPF0755 protein
LKFMAETNNRRKRILIFFICLLLISGGGYYSYDIYKKIFAPSIFPLQTFVNIPTGSVYKDVKRILIAQKIIKDSIPFNWLAYKMKYDKNIHAGHYKLVSGMSNKDLIVLLRSGKQTPVEVIFNNVRSATELASIVSHDIEADSVSLIKILSDDNYLKQYGFNSANSIGMFIPNTYQLYWNTSAVKFIERMEREYMKFWTSERNLKAKTLGFTKPEISILASIVEKETNRVDEKPVIAGVYINRYKKGWKLEADPTVVYALGNFTIQRVLNEYKEINSPYNTYMYAGLPPGPICIPSISSLDAVLNYSKHEYMYFCARDDFSGYHSFAKNYNDHLLNAKRFQKELNRRQIRQ